MCGLAQSQPNLEPEARSTYFGATWSFCVREGVKVHVRSKDGMRAITTPLLHAESR